LIKALLSEVRELSNKQLSLLDIMDDIQTNTQNEIKELNAKIINLDDTIKDLTEQLYFLQNEQKI
jgi:polyhydroxyalkanoate synthesis regulator phasin